MNHPRHGHTLPTQIWGLGTHGFKCKVCDKFFKYALALTSHTEIEHAAGFQCKVCHKIFMHRSILCKHQKNVHGN